MKETRARARQANPPIDPLVLSGLSELAAGALSGWLYTLVKTDREKARALGIKSGGRIRQWHLDLVALGGLTAMAGTAVPDLPRWVRYPLGIGAWTNAMSFLPLAFDPEIEQRRSYRTAVGASFVCTSVGFTGVALTAARRRR
ncbi:MAG TPA: hypothetical protein VII03_03205 [Solirubrobacteraceae bacterium]